MDQAEFQRRLQEMQQGQSAPPPATNGASPAQPQGGVTITVPQETVDQLGAAVGATSAASSGGPQPQPQADPNAEGQAAWEQQRAQLQAQGITPGPSVEPSLGDPTGLDAVFGGAAKSIFETKDFLMGQTPRDQMSEFRRNVYDTVDLRSQQSMIDGFAAGIAQFATSMIGLGKLKVAAGTLPWFGKGLMALESTKKGAAAVEIGKAAIAGATAFDPHEARLSNLIQDTPLANPINEWLAADPTDSAAEGRLKAALESIGLDLTLGAVFIGSSKVWKYLRNGQPEEAAKAARALEQEGRNAIDAANAPKVPDPAPVPASAADNAATDAVQRDMLDVRTRPTTQAALRLTDENTKAVYDGMVMDMRAINTHGGDWMQTVESGHTFAKGDGIPYQKLNNDGELDSFVARIAQEARSGLDEMKGGAVLHDSQLAKDVAAIADLYGEDPAKFLGVIQQAGAQATELAAHMEAAYLVANRMFQDAYALGVRISMGDYVKYGSKAAAEEALRQRVSLAASVYGSAKSMSSNTGRSLRRMQFGIDQTMVEHLSSVDPSQLTELVVATAGKPQNLKKLASPSTWTKAADFFQFLYINNLVSGPKTQLINFTTNAYMLGVRPMERIIGGTIRAALGGTDALLHIKQSLKQYTYMGQSAYDGFQQAAKAFAKNDSILTPHGSEAYVANRLGEASGVVKSGGPSFGPWNNMANIYRNSMVALNTFIGGPTRVLGGVDELMKQTTYRSKVMADAYYEGIEAGVRQGLGGKELKAFTDSYVQKALDSAFDEAGRGTIKSAVNEANIATFQQELLPNTWGKTFQNVVTKHPEARLLLPFVKTPTNVLRYGWKMTPGLNILQSEYRAMLTGKYGTEAASQAVGQMAIGSMWMGAAAYFVSQGHITGSGPGDYAANAEWRATGAQPYSFVIENEDGTKTFINYGRYDPIAIPLGIIADLQDAIAASEGNSRVEPGIEQAINALSLAMAAQFRNKAYLLGISQFMDAVAQPGTNGQKLERWFGRVASNTVPYSAAMRQFNNDPYLREARSITDNLMATVPGYSKDLPPRHDAWGDPILGRKGLWSADKNDPVDNEMQRLALTGYGIPQSPSPYQGKLDLRDLETSDGVNAYSQYQQWAGHMPGAPALKDLVKDLMETEAYQNAPDGDMSLKGTKLWMLHVPISRYRSAAMRLLKADPVVGEALLRDQLGVIDYYRARTGSKRASDMPAPTSPDLSGPDMGAIGEAFGVDLGGTPKQ